MSLGELHTLIKAIIYAIVKQSVCDSYPMFLMIGFGPVSKLNFQNSVINL